MVITISITSLKPPIPPSVPSSANVPIRNTESLLAAKGQLANGRNGSRHHRGKLIDFTYDDIKYIFVSALFHDYDPSLFHESVEWFLRNDNTIKKFVDGFGIEELVL
jgi:hypothetical protein